MLPIARARRTRVLLAEDDYEVRRALARLLELEGYQVIELSNGAALLNYLGSWILEEQTDPPAEIIITDIRMPGINGLTIVEGLRQNGWSQPIVVISAFGDETIRRRVTEMGDAVLFDKPFDVVDLRRTLAEFSNLTGQSLAN